MDIAVKFGALRPAPIVTPEGDLNTESGQAVLADRLLAMYPGAPLIGKERFSGNGFEVVTLDDLDPQSTVVVNLDVLDSVGIFQRLHRDGSEPKIMNFQWINPSTFNHPANFAAMGLAYAFFPTFCAGERTAGEVREVLERWGPSEYVNRARIAWADLGVGTTREVVRQDQPVPIVLYPAISMEGRKQPTLFYKIVTAAHKKVDFQVVARLAQSHLVTDPAMNLAQHEWTNVGPLRARRDHYWSELGKTTAFLATSLEEAYGLAYVEAMLSGVVGIYPDREWVYRLVPKDYPFVYRTREEAERLLIRAVTEPEACRAELDALVGGPFTEWVRAHHDRRDFEQVFKRTVSDWFE